MYAYEILFNGNKLKLSGVERKWQILSVTGLNPTLSTLNEAAIVGQPGVKFVGSKINKRAITLTIRVNHPCEDNRAELLRFLASNNEITLHITTDRKDLYIDGKVEMNDYNIYTQSQTMMVSIICPYPYFRNTEERITDSVVSTGGFTFPFSVNVDDTIRFDDLSILDKLIVYNYGQVETGLKIQLQFFETVIDPVVYNVDNEDEYIGFKGEYRLGDVIEINTNINVKERAVLIRNGQRTKILNKLMSGITWLKIKNILVLKLSTSGYMTIYNHDELAGI